MAKNRFKTDHPFTKNQLVSLQRELSKVSTAIIETTQLQGFPAKAGYFDIEVLHSPYSNTVFLSYWENVQNRPKSFVVAIESDGSVDHTPRSTYEFETLSDRVHFFNTLFQIEFKKA
jgi:hypothetical protein